MPTVLRLFSRPQTRNQPQTRQQVKTLPNPSVSTTTQPLSPSTSNPPPPPTSTPNLVVMAPPKPKPTSDLNWYLTDPPTKHAFQTDPCLTGKLRLGLPPGPGKEGWQGRCFKCLVRGHSVAGCRAPIPACARCRRPGHGFATCPKSANPSSGSPPKKATDLLHPRGNLGEDKLPEDRPALIDVYMPQTSDSIDNLRYLNQGVVFDARLKPDCFQLSTIQAALLAFAPAFAPFPMVRMTNHRHLLLLSETAGRSVFIALVKSCLEDMGLITYPWSPAIDAEVISYRYKVWLDFHGVPIHAWSKQHLLPCVSQFGLLLDHTTFSAVSSIENLRVLVAVRYLSDIPRKARMVIRGLRTLVPVGVVAWVDEPLTPTPPKDTTPSLAYFQSVEQYIRNKPPPSLPLAASEPLSNDVTLTFEAAFNAWLALPPSDQKIELGRQLQGSPFWALKKQQERLHRLPQPPLPLPYDNSIVSSVPKPLHTIDHCAALDQPLPPPWPQKIILFLPPFSNRRFQTNPPLLDRRNFDTRLLTPHVRQSRTPSRTFLAPLLCRHVAPSCGPSLSAARVSMRILYLDFPPQNSCPLPWCNSKRVQPPKPDPSGSKNTQTRSLHWPNTSPFWINLTLSSTWPIRFT